MADLHIVVLAAGKGTRMKSSVPKVLHRVAGKPMIGYVLDAAARLAPVTTTVVVGHQLDALKAALATHAGLRVVVQEPQLGTGHALLTTEAALQGASGILVLVSGDVPLLSADTLKTLVERHGATGAAATVMTAVVEDPRGYGRIVRSGDQIARIVEEIFDFSVAHYDDMLVAGYSKNLPRLGLRTYMPDYNDMKAGRKTAAAPPAARATPASVKK